MCLITTRIRVRCRTPEKRMNIARLITQSAFLLVTLHLFAGGFAATAQSKNPLAPDAPTYEQVMNRVAQPFLDQRRSTIAQIHTQSQADKRKAHVRETLLRLIGGLPENAGPLNAQVVGSTPEEGFHIERIIYDSLPGYHVPANLYLPSSGNGPFPAVIYHAGHSPFGKAEAFGFASNLARSGIAVLAYDPLGAGERLQAMNPATGQSWAGPDEHSQAQIPISLIGDHVSRYMVWDAMRGIDYLSSRPEIDAHSIGSFGCSGGGTLSAYLIALDERVKAGGVACFLTTYEELLKGIGPQDGEQVIPDLIQSGLDFPDLVELAAPRAYAMIATTEDMFPFAGAKAAHDEAQRFYAIYGAADHLQWFTGPGRHGAIRPLMPQITTFFRHWLTHNDQPVPELAALPYPPKEVFLCTSTGQVTTGLQGKTIYDINRERAKEILPAKSNISSREELKQLQVRLRAEVPSVTGMSSADKSIPEVTVIKTEQRAGYRLDTVTFQSLSGMELPAVVAIPDAKGRKPALLMTSDQAIATVAALGGDFDSAARAGRVVLAMTPLPWPPSQDKPRPTMGTMLPWTSRAFLVGKTFVGMRTDDVLAAVRWLATQKDVEASRIDAYGDGASGVVLLHAATLEPRIRQITIENTLSTYMSVINVPVHRGVAESVVPGILKRYDLDDLMIAIVPRSIAIVSPVDGAGSEQGQAEFEGQLKRTYAADRSLHADNRLRFVERVSGQPLSILYSDWQQ